MKNLDSTHTLYTPERAEAAAVIMQDSDPEWIYKVVHDPKGTGYSFIEVYDEENEFVERV